MDALLRTSGICWMALGPLSFISDVVTFVALHRHHASFLSCDIIFIFIVTSYMFTSLLVLFVPAVMFFAEIQWSESVCELYTSTSVIIRTAQLLGILVLCANFAVSSRIFTVKRQKRCLRFAKWIMFIISAVSVLAGIVPYSGARSRTGMSNVNFQGSSIVGNNCRFLAYNFGEGYALYFISLTSFVFLFVFIITCDSICLMKNLDSIAEERLKSGRYKIPRPKSAIVDDVATKGDQRTASMYDITMCLRQSADLCNVVILVTCFSMFFSHIPYMVIQALQLFSDVDTGTLEVMTLWSVATDAIITPPTIWLASKRYRQFWITPTNKAVPSVQMRGFVMRSEHNGTVRAVSSPQTVAPETQIPARSYMTDASGSYDVRNLTLPEIDFSRHKNGHVTTAIVECRREVGYNDVSGLVGSLNRRSFPLKITNKIDDKQGKPQRTRHRSENDHEYATCQPRTGEIQILNASNLIRTSRVDELEKIGDEADKVIDVVCKNNCTVSQNNEQECPIEAVENIATTVGVSKSDTISPSRRIWMERMRKKNLPAIFVNEAFERDKLKKRNEIQRNTHKKNGSNTSLYYFCGEYHPDNLINSLNGSLSKPEIGSRDTNMAASLTGSLTSPEVTISEDEIMTQSLTSDITRSVFGEMLASIDGSEEYGSVDIENGLLNDYCEQSETRDKKSPNNENDIENDEHFYNEIADPKLERVSNTISRTVSSNSFTKPWWAVKTNPFSNDVLHSKCEIPNQADHGVVSSVQTSQGRVDTGYVPSDTETESETFDGDGEVSYRGFLEALGVGSESILHDDFGYALTSELTLPKCETSSNPFVNGTYSVSNSEFAVQAVVPKVIDASSNNAVKSDCENARESWTDSSGFVDAEHNDDFTEETMSSQVIIGSNWSNNGDRGDIESTESSSFDENENTNPFVNNGSPSGVDNVNVAPKQHKKLTRQPVFL